MRMFGLAALFSLLLGSVPIRALADDPSELIRASILEKISRFMTWPEWKEQQFNLCISSQAPLRSAIQNYYSSETLANKPVKLLFFEQFKELKNCQLVYVNNEISEHLAAILQITEGLPILILAEKKNAVEKGAHIDFFIDENRIHLEVNRTKLTQSGLVASYHLLQVARLVD